MQNQTLNEDKQYTNTYTSSMTRLQSMWVHNGAQQVTSQAMENFTFAAFSYLSKNEYFINKGLRPYKFEKFGFYTEAPRFRRVQIPFTKWKP